MKRVLAIVLSMALLLPLLSVGTLGFAAATGNGVTEIREGKYYYNGLLSPEAGLVKVGDAYYYVGLNSNVMTGRYMVSNVNEFAVEKGVYFFFEDGKMNVEEGVYDGCYFGEGGKLTAYAGIVEWQGETYYVNDNGEYVTEKAHVLVNVNESGLVKGRRCYFDENGHMVKNAIENGAYYGASGMAPDYAGVVQVGDNFYYVGGVHGALVTGRTIVISEAKTNDLVAAGKYIADATGKLVAA